MENYMEIKNGVLDLLATINEGLLHIEKQLGELRYEEALTLLVDAMEGITAIERSMLALADLPANKMGELLKELLESMEKVIASYERDEGTLIAELLVSDVLPIFAKWKTEVERVLRQYKWT